MEFLMTVIAYILIGAVGLSVFGLVLWLAYASWVFGKTRRVRKEMKKNMDKFFDDDLFN